MSQQQPQTYSVQQILVSHETRVQKLEATIQQLADANASLQTTINQLTDTSNTMGKSVQSLQDSVQEIKDGIVQSNMASSENVETSE